MNNINILLDTLRSFLAPHQILNDESSKVFYGRDWIKDFVAAPSAITFPESTKEVQQIVRACRSARIPIVPSGGRTGLSGGATASNGEIIVSMERMRKITYVNSIDRTLECQAGVVLAKIQETALENNLYFPLDFSSRGSSQIGGNIATNAGGIKVIRYGNIRDWVIGLTVVTGSGEILKLNGSLYKNNTGLDLKNLFVGSEGILGIVTECVLKLTSKPGPLCRSMCAVSSIDDVLPFLAFCRDKLRELSAFELIEADPFNEVISRRKLRDPFAQSYPVYILVECEENSSDVKQSFQNVLGEALEAGLIIDAVLAESVAQGDELMSIRDLISETLSSHYTIHKNDIAVPVPDIPSFIKELREVLTATYPHHKVMIFGHVGDGNLHVNILKMDSRPDTEFWAECAHSDQQVFTLVQKYHGSISAEHGLGKLKRDFLGFSRSNAEISLMRSVKAAFDPDGIMNPGKVLPD